MSVIEHFTDILNIFRFFLLLFCYVFIIVRYMNVYVTMIR